MIDIYQKITNAFYAIGRKKGYSHLPPIGGILSTTFSHPVFTLPHINQELTIDGFNTALRPNDNDEGTHLVSFEQYYICTNLPLKNQFSYIREIILEVIKTVFPQELQLEDITLEEGPHEWHADSTGYKGGGGEIHITSIRIAGKKVTLGKLELAQINNYDTSGGIVGKPCCLIVFGIDRLVNFYAMTKIIKEKGVEHIPSMTIQELYLLDEQKSAFFKGLADMFLTTPSNGNDILKKINEEFLDLEKQLQIRDFSLELFQKLSQLCLFAECAYATNIITRNVRRYLIRREAGFYKFFAKHILEHPDIHMAFINHSIKNGEKIMSAEKLSIQNILSLSFLPNNFTIIPRTTEKILHKELMTDDLYKIFQNYLGIQNTISPQMLLKQNMFIRAVGQDLIKPIESLAQYNNHIYTLAGTISERLERINTLLQYLKETYGQKFKNINIKKLTSETRYLAIDWQYFSIKMYPKLQGILGSIALQQQGYNTSLAYRIRAFHTVTKDNVKLIEDLETLLVIFVGKLDDVIALFTKSFENEKSISNQDPFGIKQKMTIVTTIANMLEFSTEDILNLFQKTLEGNPYTYDKKLDIMNGYLKKRIEYLMAK